MKRVEPGMWYRHVLPHSEVCVHMQVAGKLMWAKLADNGRSVQLYEYRSQLERSGLVGSMVEFSAPILPGEAGLYSDSQGYYFNEV